MPYQYEMTKWEAKYLALAQGIKDKASIDKAEKFVEAAIRASAASAISFDEVVYTMLRVIGLLEIPTIEDLTSAFAKINSVEGKHIKEAK